MKAIFAAAALILTLSSSAPDAPLACRRPEPFLLRDGNGARVATSAELATYERRWRDAGVCR